MSYAAKGNDDDDDDDDPGTPPDLEDGDLEDGGGCCVMLCCVVLCWVMLCCDMLCCDVLGAVTCLAALRRTVLCCIAKQPRALHHSGLLLACLCRCALALLGRFRSRCRPAGLATCLTDCIALRPAADNVLLAGDDSKQQSQPELVANRPVQQQDPSKKGKDGSSSTAAQQPAAGTAQQVGKAAASPSSSFPPSKLPSAAAAVGGGTIDPAAAVCAATAATFAVSAEQGEEDSEVDTDPPDLEAPQDGEGDAEPSSRGESGRSACWTSQFIMSCLCLLVFTVLVSAKKLAVRTDRLQPAAAAAGVLLLFGCCGGAAGCRAHWACYSCARCRHPACLSAAYGCPSVGLLC